MKKHFFLTAIILLGGITYANFFSSEKMGLNTLLFAGALLTSIFGFQPELRKSSGALLAGTGVLLTALFIVWHNSGFAKFMHWISLLLLIGFAQRRELRFIFYALLLAITTLLSIPRQWLRELRVVILPAAFQNLPFYKTPLLLLPLFCVAVFGTIYYQANQKWAELVDRFWTSVQHIFQWDISAAEMTCFFIGFWLMGAGLLRSNFGGLFTRSEAKQADDLNRQRVPFAERWWPQRHLLSLKNEYWVALLTIGLLNMLLFIVNLTDLRFVWVETEMTSAYELSQYVHGGTYLLILAILLSAGILLYYFRGNQNFYSRNVLLRELAYVWIAQNAVLALSVGMRNYRYLSQYGMAYKRIGVFIFLILVLAGLFLLYLKIKDKKTAFFLLRYNAWIFYLVLTFFSAIDWDVLITRHNIRQATTGTLDAHFLIDDVGDRNLLILLENEALIKTLASKPSGIERKIKQKKLTFLSRQDTYSWRSWNWADARIKKQLLN
ncbi:MAG: hypothetical protein DHS20C18_39420 [Saprospiraceae bacterium]|nr:MAG: hypothetical protein DHS20C18_39420 [Saprospiraceae bacterium]